MGESPGAQRARGRRLIPEEEARVGAAAGGRVVRQQRQALFSGNMTRQQKREVETQRIRGTLSKAQQEELRIQAGRAGGNERIVNRVQRQAVQAMNYAQGRMAGTGYESPFTTARLSDTHRERQGRINSRAAGARVTKATARLRGIRKR